MILFHRFIIFANLLANYADLAFVFQNCKKQIKLSSIGKFVLLSYLLDSLREIPDSNIGFLYAAYQFGACGQDIFHFKTPAEEILYRLIGSEEMSVSMQLFQSVFLNQRREKAYLHQRNIGFKQVFADL